MHRRRNVDGEPCRGRWRLPIGANPKYFCLAARLIFLDFGMPHSRGSAGTAGRPASRSLTARGALSFYLPEIGDQVTRQQQGPP